MGKKVKPDVLGQEPIPNPAPNQDLVSMIDDINSINLYGNRGEEARTVYPAYDMSRFGDRLEGVDPRLVADQGPEEILAPRQSTISKWANAGGKALGLAGTTAMEGIIGLPISVANAIQSGDFEAFYNNPFAQKLDQFTAWMEEALPNYYTEEERNLGFGAKLGTANFWADSILKNLGFMAGAYLTGMAAAGSASAMMRMGKLAQTSRLLSAAAESGKTFAGLEGAALLKEMEAVGGQLAKRSAAQQLIASAVAAKAEAGIEARQLGEELDQTREDDVQELMRSFEEQDANKENTLAAIEDDLIKSMNTPVLDAEGNIVPGITYDRATMTPDMLSEVRTQALGMYADGIRNIAEDEYEKMRAGAMNTAFAENAAVLTMGNLVQFGKAFGRGYNSDRRTLNTILKNSKGQLVQSDPFVKRAANVLYRPVWEMTEEQLQGVARESMTDFVNKKAGNAGKADLGEMLQSHLEGLKETYGSQQGWEEGFAGFVMGAIGVPGFSRSYSGGIKGLQMQGGVWGEIAENKRKYAATQRVVNTLNNHLEKNHFITFSDNLIRNMNLEHDKLQYAENGDAFNYKNAEHDQFVSDVIAHINAGMFDDLVAKYESLKNSSPEELKEMFSMTNEKDERINVFDEQNMDDYEIKAKAEEISDTAIRLAKSIRDTKNIVEARFPNLKNTYGKEGADKVIETLIHYGSTIENVDDRIGDLSEVLGPEISDLVKNQAEKPSAENKNALDQAVREMEEAVPGVNAMELAEDLGKLYTRRDTFASYYNNALKGKNIGTIVGEAIRKDREEKDNAEIEGAANKEVARWAKGKRDAGNFFRIKVPGKKIARERVNPKYLVRFKNQEDKVYDEIEFQGPKIRARSGSKWDTLEFKDVSNTFDLWVKQIGERILSESSLTEKQEDFYSQNQEIIDAYVEERMNRIEQLTDETIPDEEIEAYVRIKDLQTFEIMDTITGNRTGNTLLIEEVMDQITADNTYTTEEFQGVVNRHRRVEALNRLLSRKSSLKNSIDSRIDETIKQIQEAEEDYHALLNNRTSRGGQPNQGVYRDKTGKRLKKNVALELIDSLTKKKEELTRDLAELQAAKESLNEQVKSLKKSLSSVEVEMNTPLYQKTTDLLAEANQEIEDLDKDITKIKEVISSIDDALKQITGTMKESLNKMKEVLGLDAYNTLGLNVLEELINQNLISGIYTNDEIKNILGLNFGTGFTGDILLDAITSYEKALDEVSQIEGGLDKVLNTYQELDSLLALRKKLQTNIDLLQEEINIIENELVGLVDDSYLTDAISIHAAKHGDGTDSGATISLKGRKLDISNAPQFTTGEKFNEETKSYNTPSQQRWFTVTNKLTARDIQDENYSLKPVTPESNPEYFTDAEINDHQSRKEGTAGYIKLVLHKEGEPVLEGGEEVFTSMRDIKLSQVDKEGTDLSYTNQYRLSNKAMEDAILEYNHYRTKLAEAINSGEEILLPVDGISRGVPIVEDKVDNKRQKHNVRGRIIPVDGSFDDVTLKTGSKGRLETSTGEQVAVSRIGGVYFDKNGNIINANVRSLSNEEAEVIFSLLKIYAENSDTFRGQKFSKNEETRAKAKLKINRLYDSAGNQLDDGIINAVRSMVYFGENKLTGKKGTVYFAGNYMVFGEKEVKFTAEELQNNKKLIIDVLTKATHQVSNILLKDNNPYTQIVAINEDGSAETKEWGSYKEFLMSDDRADEPVITTDLVEEGGLQFAATNLHFDIGNVEFFNITDDMRAAYQAKVEKKYARPGRKTPKVLRAGETVKTTGRAAMKAARAKGMQEFSDVIKGNEENAEKVAEDGTADAATTRQVVTGAGKRSKFKAMREAAQVEAALAEKPVIEEAESTLEKSVKDISGVTEETTPSQEEQGPEPNNNTIAKQVQEKAPERKAAAEEKQTGKKFDNPPFRNEDLRKTTNKEIIAKAKKWFNKTFPELDFNAVKEIIEGQAMGAFKDNAVWIWENAEEGTIFHEAFHVVASLYLGDEAYNQMLEDFRSSKSYNTKMKAIKASYPELSNDLLEIEALAEDFRNYMLTNGSYKTPTFLQKAFRKLWDFIRFVVFNHPRTVDNVFATIRLGAVNTKRIKQIPSHKGIKFYQKMPGLPPSAAKDLFDHMTIAFTGNLIKQVGTISGLLNQKKLQEIDINAIYNDMLNDIAEIAGEGTFLQYIQDNWVDIVAQHTKHLKYIGANISVNEKLYEEALGEDVLENEDGLDDGTKGRDSIQYIESIRFNTKDGMPNVVKFIFSSLYERDPANPLTFKPNDTFNGFKAANFGKIYNYVADSLAYLTSFEDMRAKLTEIAGIVPEVNSILRMLKADSEITDPDDFRLRQLFTQQMAKANMKYDLLYLREDGNIYHIDSNSATQSKIIKNEWKEKLLQSAIAGTNPSVRIVGDTLITDKKKFDALYEKASQVGDKGKEAKLEALAMLGITFSNNLKVVNDPRFNQAYESIVGTVRGNFKYYGENINNIYSDRAGLAKAFNTLTDLESEYSNRATEPSHQNPNGDTVYGLTLYNYLTLMRAGFLSGETLQYLEENPFIQNSIILEELKKGKVFDISILEGAKNANERNSGIKTNQMTDADRVMLTFNSVLFGKYPILRPGDKSLEYALNHEEFVPEGKLYSAEFYEIMIGYLNDELARIIAYKSSPQLRRIKNFDKKGGKLAVFADIIKDPELKMALEKVKTPEQADKIVRDNVEEILENINEYFERKAKDYVKLLVDNRVVVESDDVYLNVGISREIVEEDYLDKNTLESLAHRFAVNYFISNIEQVKIFLGDTTFFKDFFKRTSGMTGTKELAFVDPETNAFLNRNNKRKDKKEADGIFRVAVKNEVNVYSNRVDEYEAAIREHAINVMGKTKAAATKYAKQAVELYKNIEEADGQGYITLDEYREFMIREGKWDFDKQERLFDLIQSGQEISAKDMHYFQPIKAQYYGPRLVEGVGVPTYFKFSLMPLIPTMVEGTQMKSMLDEMTATKTGMMVFPSVVKVGLQAGEDGTVSDFYNEDGSPNTDMSGAFDLDYRFLGIQVDIKPKVKTKTTTGTQTRKMMISNLFKNGILQARTINGEKSVEKTQALVDRYNNAWDQITSLGYQKLLDRFGLQETEDGRFKLANAEQLVKTLREEAISRGYNNNVIQAFDEIFDPITGELTHTFSILPNSDKIQNVMMSMIRQNVMKPKLPGGNKIQGASTGFEFSKRKKSIATGKDAEKWGSNELEFYRQDENGNTLPMQVKLPYYYKQLFGGDVKKLNKELRTIIGFRIPTDGLHSIDMMEVVDFLPESAGDLIILPSEIVAKAGSDYDIDKMTVYFPDVYTDADGKYKKVTLTDNMGAAYDEYKHSHISRALWGAANRLASEWEGYLTREEMGPVVEALRLESQKKVIDLGVFNDIFSMVDKMSAPPAKLNQFRQSIAAEATRVEQDIANIPGFFDFQISAYHNELLDIQKAILRAPETFAQMINPINTGYVKRVAKYTQYLKEGNNGAFTSADFNKWYDDRFGPNPKISEEVSGTRLLEWDHIVEVSRAFQGGNAAVGMAANAFSHHVLAQQADLKFSDTVDHNGSRLPTTINFKSKKKTNYQSLSNDVDDNKDYISDTLSNIGNSYVDVANDPFIFQLNAQTDFANVMFMLLRSGVPMLEVGLFMTQPIVEKFMKDFRGNISMMIRNKASVKGGMYDKARVQLPKWEAGEMLQYGAEELSNIIYKRNNNIKLSTEEEQLEEAILMDFLRYRIMGRKLSRLIRASKQDTNLVKDLPNLEAHELNNKKTFKEENFENSDKLFSKTVLNKLKQVHEKIIPAVGQFYIEYSDRAKEVLMPIKEQLFDMHISSWPPASIEDIGKTFKISNEEFVTFLLHTVPVQTEDGQFALYQLQKPLMEKTEYRKNTVAQELYNYKYQKDFGYSDNLAIEELYPIFDRNGELYHIHNVGRINRQKSALETDLIIEDFRRLFELNENFATNLVRVGLLQSGKSNTPISFISIVPFEQFSKIAKPILKSFQTNSRLAINWDEFNDQLKKNLSKNSLIVPYQNPWIAPPRGKPFRLVRITPHGEYIADLTNADGRDYIVSTHISGDTRTTVFLKNTGEIIEKPGKDYVLTRFSSDPELGDGFYLRQYYPSLREANKNSKTPQRVVNTSAGIQKASAPVGGAKITSRSYAIVKPKDLKAGDLVYTKNGEEYTFRGIKEEGKLKGSPKLEGADKRIYYPGKDTDLFKNVGFEAEVSEEYQLEESVTEGELPLTSAESRILETKIKSFLAKVGVSYNPTTQIFDAQGNPISATAKADILAKILEVVEGKATISTLPEEAAHFFVEMLNDNVMLDGMMRGIENTKVLQDTFKSYNEVYNGDINKIKKEAIGKLIMAYMLKEVGGETDTHDAWIQDIEKNKSLLRRIWEWLKKLFSRLSSDIMRTESNLYKRAARSILIGDISRLDIDAGTGEFYQVEENKLEDTTNSILNSTIKIAKDDSSGEYIVDGERGYTRVTDEAKKAQKKPYKDAPSQRDQAKWAIDRTTGTLVHGLLSNIIKRHFPKQNEVVSEFTNEDIRSNPDIQAIAYDLEESIWDIIQETKDMGGYLLSEVKVADVADKVAGTIDLIRVRPDGTVDIFDFKTKSSNRISRSQEKEYTIQISRYAKILEKGSLGGMPLTVRHKRIIPITKKYDGVYRKSLIDYLEKNLKTFEDADLLPVRGNIYEALKEAAGLEDKITGGLTQIPIITESTEEEGLDTLISKLNKQIALEERRLSKTQESKEREALMSSIDKKKDLIKQTQLYKDIVGIALAASADMDFIEFNMRSEDFNFDKDYRQYLEVLKIYRDLPQFVEAEGENKKVTNRVDLISGRAGRLIKVLNTKAKDIMVKAAEETVVDGTIIESGEDVLEAQKGTNWFKYISQGISVTHHPLLATLQKKVTLALGRSRARAKETSKKLKTLGAAVEKAVGKTGPAAFEIFQQVRADGTKTGNAVSRFKPEYWKRRQEAINENDVEWLQENTDIDQEYFDKRVGWFNDHLSRVYDYTYESKYKELVEEGEDRAKERAEYTAERYVESLAEEWRSKYMLEGEPNILYFNKPKENSEFLDERYKTIMADKALREFYELYTEIIEEAQASLPMQINNNFWPNFTASFMELASTVGVAEAVGGMSKRTISRLEAGADPWTYGLQTPSSEEVRDIPMAGIAPLDADTKSYDLPQVMSAFAESMYRHQELERIHGLALATNQFVKDQTQGQGEVVRNPDGSVAKDEYHQPVRWTNKAGSFTAKQLDDFVDYIFYGKSRNDRGAKVKMPDNKLTRALGIAGKTINAMKILDGGLTYVAIKNLGLNLFSPTVNLLQGTTSALMEGAGGRYYTVKDFMDAARLITTADKKTWAIIDEFSTAVGQREFTRQMRKEMTTVKGGKLRPTEILFKLQEMGELAVQYAVLVAIMRGSKAERFGIKFSDVEYKDGKLNWLKDFSVDQKTIFTAKVNAVNVKIVGNYNPDDRAAAKRYFAGRAIMQHRTWLPAMFDNRWGSERYDFILEEYFIGRYRALAKKQGLQVLKAMAKKGFFFTSIDQLKKDTGVAEHYVHAIRADMMEMLLISIMLGLRWGLSGRDDDDSTGVEKYTMRTIERLISEMAFFVSPNQAFEVLQSPAPMLTAYSDFGRMLTHTGKEIWGNILGDEEMQKSAHPWKYTKRQFPVVGQVDRFVEFMEKD